MTKEDYLRLSVHIAMLEDIAEEYPGQDNREYHCTNGSKKEGGRKK